MNLADIHTYAWSYLDVDESDLHAVLMDQWVQACQVDIFRSERRWPFLRTNWSFTTTPSQQVYTYAEIDATCDEIEQVDGTFWTVEYVDHLDAERNYGNYWANSAGTPYGWSTLNKNLYFWPLPDAALTYTITGFRTPTPLVVGGSTSQVPDILASDTDFTQAVLEYVLAAAYLQQDDAESAGPHQQMYVQELAMLHKRLMKAPMPRPLVAHGGIRRSTMPPGPMYPPQFPRS